MIRNKTTKINFKLWQVVISLQWIPSVIRRFYLFHLHEIASENLFSFD
jgi:hypothetical protein